MSKISSICEENFARLFLASSLFHQKSWNSTHTFLSLSWIHILSFVSIFQFLSKIWAFYAQNWVITERLPFQSESSMWFFYFCNVLFIHWKSVFIMWGTFLICQTSRKWGKVSTDFTKFQKNFNFHLKYHQ